MDTPGLIQMVDPVTSIALMQPRRFFAMEIEQTCLSAVSPWILFLLVRPRHQPEPDIPTRPNHHRPDHRLGEGDDGMGLGELPQIFRHSITTRPLSTRKDRIGLQVDFRDWSHDPRMYQRLEHE